MLAEGGKAELFSYGFDIVYGWDFAYKLKDLYSGKITTNGLYESHRKEYEQLKDGQQRMRYSTNHDMSSDESPIESFNGERGNIGICNFGDNGRNAHAIQFARDWLRHASVIFQAKYSRLEQQSFLHC